MSSDQLPNIVLTEGARSAQEHPDTQATITSIRTIHGHNAIQMSDLLQPRNQSLQPSANSSQEHPDSQLTVRSVAGVMRDFESHNMEAIELAWSDLAVYSNEGKALLNGDSAKICGSFLAIMGPSGGGKSTLLNTLACRANGIKSDGIRLINGEEYSLTELKQLSGYVMQDDLLNGRLTVEETLFYAAELRLPSNMSSKEKQNRIDDVIQKLGLEKCRHTIIGDPMKRGISGGERKRTAVAIELLTRPRLLFLDEPTSGLDSVTAASLCGLLRDLAHSGQCTVITTIHQPQTKIFNMFDDLILLKSGHIVYYGAAGEVTDFFAEAGYPCPPMTNPADHILDVITVNPTDDAKNAMVDEAEKKLKAMRVETVVDVEKEQTRVTNKIVHQHQRASWWHQFVILLRRSFMEQLRSREIMITLLVQNILIAVLIGTVFLQIGDTQTSVVRRQPLLFFCVINQGIFSSLMMINSFPKERVLVLRERAAGTYYASAYFLAKNIADLAGQIAGPIFFSCIVYFLAGLQADVGRFFIFMGFMVLCSVASTSLALMISALARTTDMAVTILPMALELARLYGGFFLSPANLPKYFVWLDAISYVKYAYTGISLNELTDLKLRCTETQLVNGNCPITTGEQTIRQLGLDYITIGMCAGALIIYTIVARFIAYLGIRYIKR